jgi:hypothetical protein
MVPDFSFWSYSVSRTQQLQGKDGAGLKMEKMVPDFSFWSYSVSRTQQLQKLKSGTVFPSRQRPS